MAAARIARVFGAVNLGSFRVSAMIMGLTEGGEMIVLGSSHRAQKRASCSSKLGSDAWPEYPRRTRARHARDIILTVYTYSLQGPARATVVVDE